MGAELVGSGSMTGCLAGEPERRNNDPRGTAGHESHFSTAHLMTNLRRRTVSSGFVTAASQCIQFVLTLGSTMILARLLEPQDFGLVAMVTTIVAFLRVFREAGLSTATVQREGITHAQVSNLFWINFGLSSVVSLVLIMLAPVVAWFYREPRLVSITFALGGTFLLTGSTVQHMALLNRQMRFKVIALIQVGSLMAGVVVGIGMAMLKFGYWSLVGFQLAIPFTTLVLAWSASRWRPQLPAPGSGTRPLISFGVNLAAGGFLWSLARGADCLLIGRYYGADPVGLYSRAGALLMRPLEQSMSPIEAVFVPTLSRLQEQPDRYRRAFLIIHEGIAMAGFLFGGILLALAHPLTLIVLGAKWEKVAVIFAAFTVSALFYPLTTATSWLFSSQGRGKDWLSASSILSVLTLCTFLAGMPFGPAGVAIAFSVSGVFILLPIMYYIAGRTGPVTTRNLWAGFLRQLPVWGIACGSTVAIKNFIAGLSPLAECLIFGPMGLVVGIVFIGAYTPSRTVAINVLSTIREARRNRRTY